MLNLSIYILTSVRSTMDSNLNLKKLLTKSMVDVHFKILKTCKSQLKTIFTMINFRSAFYLLQLFQVEVFFV